MKNNTSISKLTITSICLWNLDRTWKDTRNEEHTCILICTTFLIDYLSDLHSQNLSVFMGAAALPVWTAGQKDCNIFTRVVAVEIKLFYWPKHKLFLRADSSAFPISIYLSIYLHIYLSHLSLGLFFFLFSPLFY